MQMLRVSGMPGRYHGVLAVWRSIALGLTLAGVGMLSPASAGGAAEAPSLAPGPGCGATEGAPAVLRPGLVRAEPAKRRRQAERATLEPEAGLEAEPPAIVRHAFYACLASPLAPAPMGLGWLARGPVRKA